MFVIFIDFVLPSMFCMNSVYSFVNTVAVHSSSV